MNSDRRDALTQALRTAPNPVMAERAGTELFEWLRDEFGLSNAETIEVAAELAKLRLGSGKEAASGPLVSVQQAIEPQPSSGRLWQRAHQALCYANSDGAKWLEAVTSCSALVTAQSAALDPLHEDALAALLAKFCQSSYASAMSTMNVSLPENLKAFVDEQVNQRGYGTSSEYMRELIRKDQDRQHLRSLLTAGAASAPMAPVNEAYFEGLRNRVRKAPGARRKVRGKV
jgi:antitoxin ParD1/3/4